MYDWYDTPDGIRAHLNSLANFQKLLEARRFAGYQLRKRLTEFYLFENRIWLDSVGNCFVQKLDEPKAYVLRALPEDNCQCPVCGQGWTISDFLDSRTEQVDKTMSLTRFKGETLSFFKNSLRHRKESIWFSQPGSNIRNDRFIDLNQKPNSTDYVNNLGWTTQSDDYVIQEGDETVVTTVTFYHPDCFQGLLLIKTREHFQRLLDQARIWDYSLRSVTNQYGSASYRGPWFEVHTEFGTFTIGWRAHVMEIDWSSTKTSLLHLFEDVQDTKDDYYIHAWTDHQAIDYLGRIKQALQKETA